MNNSSSHTADLPFISHLIELRNRLMRIVIFIACIALPLSIYANEIYALLAQPLMAHLPQNSTMIATNVTSPFMTPFKLSLVTAVFISMPFVLYQFWGFLAPALYRNEQRTIFPLLVASTILFYCGVAFAYFVVAPLVLAFFSAAAPTGVTVMTDIEAYLGFVLSMFLAFGLAFEVPIAVVVLARLNVVTIEKLKDFRGYFVVLAFVIAAIVTPPDVVSQLALAIPMCVLYELGIWAAQIFIKHTQAPKEEESAT
jgi:sec-independent protein translocase protein TatC